MTELEQAIQAIEHGLLRVTRAATAHSKTDQPIPGKWHMYPEQAAASLWSTPSDLARFIVERRLSQHHHRLPGNWTRDCLDDQWRKRQTPWT